MPFVTAIPKLVLAANAVATTLTRPSGARPIHPPRQLGDLEVCLQPQQDDITRAFNEINIWYVPVIRNQGGDWATLANMMQTRSIASVTISCNVCYGGATNPYTSSDFANQSLQVCNGFGTGTNERRWLQELILTELVRLCGGTDLDAYAVKNFLFSISRTSSPYVYYSLSSSEKDRMCLGGARQPSPWPYLAGKFTIWDNAQGQLWPSTHSGTLIQPYGSSLIPFGNPRIYWQHPC